MELGRQPRVALPIGTVSRLTSVVPVVGWWRGRYEGGSSYWALDIGLVHVLCLNTYAHSMAPATYPPHVPASPVPPVSPCF